jgi:hypothetical protein
MTILNKFKDLSEGSKVLLKVKDSEQLTSLYKLVQIGSFFYWNFIYIFYKTGYLNEEVNSTKPSPLLVFPAKGRGLGQPEGHAFFSSGSSLVDSGKITSLSQYEKD